MEVRENAPDDLGPNWTGSRPPLRPEHRSAGTGLRRGWPGSSPIDSLIGRYADQIGRIAHRCVPCRGEAQGPVWVGNALLLLAVVVGGLAVWAAYAWTTPLWKGFALIAAGAIWTVAVHSPTHWLVGTWWGSVDRLFPRRTAPAPARPEVRLRQRTCGPTRFACLDARQRGDRHQVRAVRGAGLLARSGAPGWAAAVPIAIGVLQIVTDLTLSTKSSDWKKFAREKGVARARRVPPSPSERPGA